MLAHSICRVFFVNFLLSSQAPNSAELKWNEVIRAAGCEDVLGLAYSGKVGQEQRKERSEPLKQKARQETHHQASSLGKPLPSPWVSSSLQLCPETSSPGLAPHNQASAFLSRPLFRHSHQLHLTSTHTTPIILLLYHGSCAFVPVFITLYALK